jgi:hypothetical protein
MPFGVFWLKANGQELEASCLSKTVHRTTFPLWSEFPTLPFVRFYVKQKATSLGGETAIAALDFAIRPAYVRRNGNRWTVRC